MRYGGSFGSRFSLCDRSVVGRKCEYSLQDGNIRSCGKPEVAGALITAGSRPIPVV